MKKIAILGLAFVFSFGLFTASAHAATQCGDPANSNASVTYVACGNGPIVPQQPGGRFLKAGEEDCPSWFPQMFGHACYTMRAFGAYFIPLH